MNMAENIVQTEDLCPVGSRISWGPIFAGASLALALYFLLALLGAAVGLSVSDNASDETMATGAAIWAVLTTVVSLFAGGFIASQFMVGENRNEAAVYGLIVWAVVFGMLLWLMASGVRTSLNAMVGVATAASNTTPAQWESAAIRAGVPREQIDAWRRAVVDAPAEARQAAENPQNQQAALEATRRATWWAFGGTLLSMIAASIGAVAGTGPNFRFLSVGTGYYAGGKRVVRT
jgi:hypothetical protein